MEISQTLEQLQALDHQIPDKMYFKIGEVADIVGVKPYVLRYWESEFSILSPARGSLISESKKEKSQQRVYTRADIEKILLIKHLLYIQRFSIEGAKKRLAEMRKTGELTASKKIKIAIDQDRFRLINEAISEVQSLIALCSTR